LYTYVSLRGGNLCAKFQILTVLGAVFPLFCPYKREIWHGDGGAALVSNLTFIILLLIIIIQIIIRRRRIIADLYSAFRSEDTEVSGQCVATE